MSGTEAVMSAARVARFNTRKKLIVLFGGAYHGWWDGVQTTAGNERAVDDTLTLRDLDSRSLDVIRCGAARRGARGARGASELRHGARSACVRAHSRSLVTSRPLAPSRAPRRAARAAPRSPRSSSTRSSPSTQTSRRRPT
jgi:hypothetical protein